MDEALLKSGAWPNVALVPGTHTHAATGEHVEQPENTRIRPSRGACRPDDADCESEPAGVENRPQDGSECDTREKLEADIMASNYPFVHTPAGFRDIKSWLNRQVAITQDECERLCDTCAWPSLAAQPDQEAYDQIAELTAERDSLRSRLKTQANSFQKLERDNAKLRDTLAQVRELLRGDV